MSRKRGATIRNDCRKKPAKPADTPIVHERGRLYAYTDGSTFRANPGPISWAVVYVRDGEVAIERGRERIIVGAAYHGNNVRAELVAVVTALEHEQMEHLTILTDSIVTIHHIEGTYQRKANPDLWLRFEAAMERRNRRGCVTVIEHVRGHHTDPFNKYADRLASDHARANFALVEIARIV